MAAVPGGDGSVSLPFLFMRLSRACYSNISNQANRNDTDFQVVLSPMSPKVFCLFQVMNKLSCHSTSGEAKAAAEDVKRLLCITQNVIYVIEAKGKTKASAVEKKTRCAPTPLFLWNVF